MNKTELINSLELLINQCRDLPIDEKNKTTIVEDIKPSSYKYILIETIEYMKKYAL